MTCLVPGFPRQASTDHWESADRIDPALAAEATESTDATEPTEPIDKIEPADPIDKMDPAEPIDKIDPLEPMLRMDPLVFRMESILAVPEPAEHRLFGRRLLRRVLPGRGGLRRAGSRRHRPARGGPADLIVRAWGAP